MNAAKSRLEFTGLVLFSALVWGGDLRRASAWCYMVFDPARGTFAGTEPPLDISMYPVSAEYEALKSRGGRIEIIQNYSCYDGWTESDKDTTRTVAYPARTAVVSDSQRSPMSEDKKREQLQRFYDNQKPLW